MTWDIRQLVTTQRVGKSDMINNTQELQEYVWSKIGDRLKSRRIDFYDLKRLTQEEFTAIYNEAWDVQIKSMGITNN